MSRRPKLKLAVIALMTVILTMLSQTSLAYYTVTGIGTNVVTSGNVQLRIHETAEDGSPFPAAGVTVIPGDTVHKEVSVENISGHPFWLRVKLVWDDDSEDLEAEEVLQVMDLNETEWIAQGDYYYYYRPLMPSETTEPIFEKVHLVGALVDQHDIGAAITITVKAAAVQSENNPAKHPWDASGWPQM